MKKQKLIKAMITIIDQCNDNDCSNCIMYIDAECSVKSTMPVNWNLKGVVRKYNDSLMAKMTLPELKDVL